MKKMAFKLKFIALLFIVLSIFVNQELLSQPQIYSTSKDVETQGIQWRAGWINTFAAENEQAFWLTKNDLGLLSDQSANSLFTLDGFTKPLEPMLLGRKLSLAAGWKLAFNLAEPSSQVFFPVLFGRADYGSFRLEAGRFDMQWDQTIDDRLSSGDLIYGTNATPIPMIRLSTPEAIKPFKSFFPEFGMKGYLIHGWFENNRFVRAAYLHAKNITLQIDLDGFRPVFGISHNAQWAGTSREYGNLPDTFNDFKDVFMVNSSSNAEAPDGEIINVAGNHIGMWNMGFDVESPSMESSIRFHHVFEDGSGKRMRNGSDGKIEFSVRRKQSKSGKTKSLVTELTYEYYNTTNASGIGSQDAPILGQAFDEFGYRFGGRDAYFTNFIYQSGWTYQDQAINSPFFMTLTDAIRLAPDGQNPEGFVIDGTGIASGSILAHHIGWKGHFHLFGSDWSYRQKSSIVRYYGNSNELPFYFAPYRYRDDVVSSEYAFYPDVVQYYFRFDLEKQITFIDQQMLATLSLAADRGEWQRNFGIALQLEWEF